MSGRRPALVALVGAALGLAASAPGCTNIGKVVGLPQIADSPARRAAAGRRVLIVVSAHGRLGKTKKKTGYWLSEVTHFYHVLARHGLPIDFVSPGGAPPIVDPDSVSMRDGLNKTFWRNPALRAKIRRPLHPRSIDPRRYAVIYYAGGHGTMWDFPNARGISRLAAEIYEAGGIVAAVCHGPAGLLEIKLKNGRRLIDGRRVTGFANTEEWFAGKKSVVPYLLQDALRERGGRYSKSWFPFASHVVVDGRLITGQNPNSSEGVAEAVVRVLAATRATK